MLFVLLYKLVTNIFIGANWARKRLSAVALPGYVQVTFCSCKRKTHTSHCTAHTRTSSSSALDVVERFISVVAVVVVVVVVVVLVVVVVVFVVVVVLGAAPRWF